MEDKKRVEYLFEIPGIDTQLVMTNLELDLNLFQELLQIYYKETTTLITKIEQGIKEDIDSFRIYIHTIKGSTASLGGYEVAEMAAVLEEAAKQKDAVAIEKRLPMFIKQVNYLLQNIKVYIDKYINVKETQESIITSQINKQDLIKLKEGFDYLDIDIIESYIRKLRQYQYLTPQQKLMDDLVYCMEELEYKKGSQLIAEYLRK